MKLLLINGHKYYSYSQGMLNKTIFEEIIRLLSDKYEIQKTIIEKGYDTQEEIEKFLWADKIIFQTPINWFSVPWSLKKYYDEIYQYGIFYTHSEKYGKGGLLTNKKYMYSLTWNTSEKEFEKTERFFDLRSVDDIIIALHKTQEYCGMKKIPTFSLFDVVKNPNIEHSKKLLKAHLQKYF